MRAKKTATVADLRNNFAVLSKWLEEGEPITITKHGAVFATLVPAERKKKNRPIDRLGRLRKIFPKGVTRGNIQDIIHYERGNT